MNSPPLTFRSRVKSRSCLRETSTCPMEEDDIFRVTISVQAENPFSSLTCHPRDPFRDFELGTMSFTKRLRSPPCRVRCDRIHAPRLLSIHTQSYIHVLPRRQPASNLSFPILTFRHPHLIYTATHPPRRPRSARRVLRVHPSNHIFFWKLASTLLATFGDFH